MAKQLANDPEIEDDGSTPKKKAKAKVDGTSFAERLAARAAATT